MTERPILFSASMVLALLAGTKTQTRRLIKPQSAARPMGWGTREEGHSFRGALKCPYGKPGDRLWVKETWLTERTYDDLAPRDLPKEARIWFQADRLGEKAWDIGKGRPSIFMMRCMSRLLLEVKDVRVERLQDITEADAKAEGVENRLRYADLWDKINGATSWRSNPWVWVVSFARLAP